MTWIIYEEANLIDRRGRQLARLDPAHGGDGRCDRHANLKVENLWIHPQLVRERMTAVRNAGRRPTRSASQP